MLNFRKLFHDFSQSTVKEGRHLLEQNRVTKAVVTTIVSDSLKMQYLVEGAFQHAYRGHLDIDINGSEIRYSDCDCSKKYDCEHIASACLYLEANYDQLLADYALQKEPGSPKQKRENVDRKVVNALKTAKENAARRANESVLQETLAEYLFAQKVLSESAFFDDPKPVEPQQAEAILLLDLNDEAKRQGRCELQLVLRIDSRTKPIQVSQLREFFEALEYEEPQIIASRQHWLTYDSFSEYQQKMLRLLYATIQDSPNKEKTVQISFDVLGTLLANARQQALTHRSIWLRGDEPIIGMPLESIYLHSLDQPLKWSQQPAFFTCSFHRMEIDEIKVMVEVYVKLAQEQISLSDLTLLACRQPGLIYHDVYHSFEPSIQRRHLKAVQQLNDLVVPRPLLGTLMELGLPSLKKSCQEVRYREISSLATLPIDPPRARCEIIYSSGKMEVDVTFHYKNGSIPAVPSKLTLEQITQFITPDAILARDIWYEKRLLAQLFTDFQCDETKGVYIARSDRAIVDFMTRLVPLLRDRVDFDCPHNLLEQFIYDTTTLSVHAKCSSQVHQYDIEIKIEGPLQGLQLSQIWECISSDRSYIELPEPKGTRPSKASRPKILVLELPRMRQLARFLDDLGIDQFISQTYHKPLWTLTHLDEQLLKDLPFEVILDQDLKEIQEQLWGNVMSNPKPVPKAIKADLRGYQIEGMQWLEKLRRMHLAGVLADDMGLGKTLQAIAAITQLVKEKPGYCSLVICPTSLVYNWKEEVSRFNPALTVQIVDGTPPQRKKLIEEMKKFDIAVTSYSLLQKDVEHYQSQKIGYVILDEAQYIKNRQTQNARCVRQITGLYRLALTGTPVENSLDELWSLFDFLMPGLMSSYERFIEKYMKKSPSKEGVQPLAQLRRKIAPFVLRRMKCDVLDELPPVSEIVYHCELNPKQRELYTTYAETARKELSAMVARDGFDKVRIHVLATLTRLKQICCHPAIFATDLEPTESAKYDLFWQVIENLLLAGRKAVVFSQYTKMLGLMRRDLEERSISYCYLDGSTKNRLEVVKLFNESETPIFLVSLKAGGTGLNLTGADTVIHYDLWWNPAVEDQATDRVHRMGQKARVSSYKLVTLGTIEEKIVELQNRKKGLVRQLVVDDEEAIEKLTWEEVLQLLQT